MGGDVDRPLDASRPIRRQIAGSPRDGDSRIGDPSSRRTPVPSPRYVELTTYIAGLPKAELNVDLVGAVSRETVARLARRYAGSTIVPAEAPELAKFYTFTHFDHFVDVNLAVTDLLRTPEDIWTVTYDVAGDLAGQTVRYAEMTLTPYMSVLAGIPAEAFCDAVEDARRAAVRDHRVELAWVFDIPSGFGIPAADATLDIALRLRPDGLVAFGLGGPEDRPVRRQFAPHFDAARAAGLHSAPSSGEAGGAESVWDAVELLGAERIGHGIGAVEDEALLDHLGERGIALEISPSSNVCTRVVASLADHPLPRLAAADVPLSIASDSPVMFSTTLNHEYAIASELLHLDAAAVTEHARWSVSQSFAPTPRKRSLLSEIAEYEAANAPDPEQRPGSGGGSIT
jgi:adenosine deaminase